MTVHHTLPQLFEFQVRRSPDNVAVVHDGERMTYDELNRAANRLAHHLIGQGLGAEDIVAIVLPRSLEMVVAIVAVAKAGAAYLPVDPNYPAERIDYLITDARPTAVLVTGDTGSDLRAEELLRLDLGVPETAVTLSLRPDSNPTDADRRWPASAAHPAYVIYTSGSTGKPKGVVMAHRGAVRLFSATEDRFAFGADDVWTIFHSFSFDFSVWEMWGPLLYGGRLVVVSHEVTRSPWEFLELLVAERVTVLSQTPSAFYQLIQAEREHPETARELSLRVVVFDGEILDMRRLAEWYERHPDDAPVMANMYGITEAAVHATYAELDSHTRGSVDRSPIGTALCDLTIDVLGPGLERMPAGSIGEMYVSGPGLARGYLGRPGLTAGRFVASPYEPGRRMYRTGDLACWTAAGQLEFVGRADAQIQVRGFRVEPGEIEAALTSHPGVAQAVVLPWETGPGDSRLAAYVVASAGRGAADPHGWREHLGRTLPEHMVPSAFITVDAIPLTVNGKLDRRALPAPDLSTVAAGRAPRTRQEEILCGVVAELLGVPTVGTDRGFLSLGGDSIAAVQLVGRARRAGLSLTTRDVLGQRSLAGLAAVSTPVDTAPGESDDNAGGPLRLTPGIQEVCGRGGPLDRFSQSLVLSAPAGLTRTALLAVLQALLDGHDALRLRVESTGAKRSNPTALPVGAADADACLTRIDARGVDDADMAPLVAEGIDAARSRLSLQDGVVVQAVWFDRGVHCSGSLALVVSQLAVDGASWRILIADLRTLWDARAVGDGPPRLPVGRISYRRWSQLLATEARAPRRIAELPDWTRAVAGTVPGAPAHGQGPAHGGEHRLTVPADLTEALLATAPAALSADTGDLLLAGLVLAIAERQQRHGHEDGETVVIDLEGSGRAVIREGADPSHTLGRFAAPFPVPFPLGLLDWNDIHRGGPAVGRALQQIRHRLRHVPDNGFGYGLLRHLNAQTGAELAAFRRPELKFSYLGRFPDGQHCTWPIDPEYDIGPDEAGGLPMTHRIEVHAVACDRPGGAVLRTIWTWADGDPAASEAHELADSWLCMLTALTAYAKRQGSTGLAPPDVTLSSISQSEIDDLEAELNAR
ncbi:amino acid adenylation domain-containing protein [Streptomyces sp. JUS-F4]|uniref:amino acid adenylation domain-containing protein n=1 Tax=Streptomyces sp. JUS-F4 TaxID=2951988 RepID=UPI00266521E4|nr:amino acid adenylation domain-containing protein [Streptomyces sp. JUS-F4]WKN18650.1 amino acid adenylation domain-containing protein [Streptomyces sp. JUS-F4]